MQTLRTNVGWTWPSSPQVALHESVISLWSKKPHLLWSSLESLHQSTMLVKCNINSSMKVWNHMVTCTHAHQSLSRSYFNMSRKTLSFGQTSVSYALRKKRGSVGSNKGENPSMLLSVKCAVASNCVDKEVFQCSWHGCEGTTDAETYGWILEGHVLPSRGCLLTWLSMVGRTLLRLILNNLQQRCFIETSAVQICLLLKV